jgi:signal transduction histidine kinase/CheY-like chemotaxis protein
MRDFLLKTFNKFRLNGTAYAVLHNERSQIVNANLIWLGSYLSFFIYTLLYIYFFSFNTVFTGLSLFFHLAFIFTFLLIKDGYTNVGKHTLLLCTNIAIFIFDHFCGAGANTFIYLFAFLPSSLLLFNIKKNPKTIVFYTVLPFVYLVAANFYTYQQIPVSLFINDHIAIFKTWNLSFAYFLFLIISAALVIGNGFRNNRLMAKSYGLQVTLNNASGSIWSIDTDFNLIVTNQMYIDSIKSEFGIDEMCAGKNIRHSGLWDKMPAILHKQYLLVLEGNEIYTEFRLNDKEFEIKGIPVFTKQQLIIGATFSCSDITRKKNFENALIEANKQAEEATRSKERFLSNMSHEIRTPLNGIVGIVDMLSDETCLPGQKENLANLKNLSQYILQVASNILDYAKIDSGKAFLDNKRFGLRQFIHKIKSIFRNQSKLRGIAFTVNITGNHDIYVMGDEVRLSQVLINLLGNAIKFTEKGTVELRLNIVESADEENYFLKFEIIDSGIGIKQENIEKIFESFTQAEVHTTRKFGGTGLGLTISEKLLNLMQSRLIVESEIRKGSKFYFQLQLKKSSYLPPVRLADAKSFEKKFLPNLNILLAEDNKINQMVANNILLKWKTRVTIVDDGFMAYEKVKENTYDIILMDLDMPVMDGYESMDLIRNLNSKIPVIALTAASFEDMENSLKKRGFSQVVQKPFLKEDLYQKILELVV